MTELFIDVVDDATLIRNRDDRRFVKRKLDVGEFLLGALQGLLRIQLIVNQFCIDGGHCDYDISTRCVRAGHLSIFEFLEPVSKLITGNAQKFGGACLIPTTSLYCLSNKRKLGFVERDAFLRQNEERRAGTDFR